MGPFFFLGIAGMVFIFNALVVRLYILFQNSMAKKILIHFNEEEHRKFEKLLEKQQKETGRRNASALLKRAVFERRERKKMVALAVEDLVFRSQVKSKVTSILGDLKAGRDIILSLRELEKLASKGLENM